LQNIILFKISRKALYHLHQQNSDMAPMCAVTGAPMRHITSSANKLNRTNWRKIVEYWWSKGLNWNK